MKQFATAVWILAFPSWPISAQPIRSFVGTVAAIEREAGGVSVQPDNGERVLAKISSDTILQRVEPGEKDLKKATAIQADDIAPGDRVLVSLEPGTNGARRIVVMAVADIKKRDEADRQDWIVRGVSGVVTAKKGNEITLSVKSPGADKAVVVAITSQTTFRRYAPDSVRFSDAKPSAAEEVHIGDQLRARGRKSEEGLRVTAENIVFGTFITKAGAVTSFDAAAREIHVAEIGTGIPLVVKLMADTQIKALPDVPGVPFAGPGRGLAGGPGGGGPGGRGGFSAPDPAELIERMPTADSDAIKTGQTVIISSTKGVKADEITAITIVANAQMLIQMASMQSNTGRGGQANASGGLSPGVMSGMGAGGLGLDLSGMIP
jgi:hypothetical protein